MSWHHDGAAGSWGVLLMVLVLWAVTILCVWAVARGDSGSTGPAADEGRDPLRVLAEQLARGEIDAEEYRTRRKILEERW